MAGLLNSDRLFSELFMMAGEKWKLRLGEMSNSDNDASTYASITERA